MYKPELMLYGSLLRLKDHLATSVQLAKPNNKIKNINKLDIFTNINK